MDAGDDQDVHAKNNVFLFYFFLVGVGGGLSRDTISLDLIYIYRCRGANETNTAYVR